MRSIISSRHVHVRHVHVAVLVRVGLPGRRPSGLRTCRRRSTRRARRRSFVISIGVEPTDCAGSGIARNAGDGRRGHSGDDRRRSDVQSVVCGCVASSVTIWRWYGPPCGVLRRFGVREVLRDDVHANALRGQSARRDRQRAEHRPRQLRVAAAAWQRMVDAIGGMVMRRDRRRRGHLLPGCSCGAARTSSRAASRSPRSGAARRRATSSPLRCSPVGLSSAGPSSDRSAGRSHCLTDACATRLAMARVRWSSDRARP